MGHGSGCTHNTACGLTFSCVLMQQLIFMKHLDHDSLLTDRVFSEMIQIEIT